jgi:hypothetical protein
VQVELLVEAAAVAAVLLAVAAEKVAVPIKEKLVEQVLLQQPLLVAEDSVAVLVAELLVVAMEVSEELVVELVLQNPLHEVRLQLSQKSLDAMALPIGIV